MDGPRLSLVLPAYNEEAGLRRAIAEADESLSRWCGDYEVLVVDDGSRDATAAIAAEESSRRPHVRLLRHEANRGYGAALRTGFEAARFELVAFTDADCQFHLDDLEKLLPLTRKAVVVGYRVDRQDPWRRRFLSRGYNALVRFLLGTRVRDCDCALKVFRREELLRLLPETAGFFVNTEMLARARMLGVEVVEVGVRHRPRLLGKSTVSLREAPKTLAQLLPFWWSRVLFAGPSFSPLHRERERGAGDEGAGRAPAEATPHPQPLSPEDRGEGRKTTPHPQPLSPEAGERGERPPLTPNPSPLFQGRGGKDSSPWLILPLLLLVAGLLFFSRLRAPLLEPQEARYAEIPRQMLQHGQFLLPTLHGQPYLDKPPLLYWLVMASYKTFGVHDWAARLVPGLAGLLTVLATWLWGRRLFGVRAGLCGALVLCLAPEFIYRARMLTFDTLLALWVVVGLACTHAALSSGRLRPLWWTLSALACGLGLLTKGPVALALVAGPIVGLSLLDPRLARPGWRAWFAWLAVAGGIAAPWYIAVMRAMPDFAGYFFWKHNVVRFFAPFDHARSTWFYLPGLLAGLLPWTLLVPGLVLLLVRRNRRSAARRPAGLGFVLFSFAWILVFFSASGCKRPTYLLPALPPLALALGWYVHLQAPNWQSLLRKGSSLATSSAVLVLVGGLGVTLLAAHLDFIKPQLGFALAGTALAALAAVALWPRRLPWAGSAAVCFVALLLGVQHLQPAYNKQFALRGQLRRHVTHAELRDRPVVCFPQRFDSVSFYLPQSKVRSFAAHEVGELLGHLEEHPNSLLLVKSGSSLQQLLRHLPPGVTFATRQRGGAIAVGRIVRRDGLPAVAKR